jgi:hypothetical protein
MSTLDRYPESIHARVASDLASRLHAGINEYGVPLVAHNGRDAFDLACYLRQAIEERDNPA